MCRVDLYNCIYVAFRERLLMDVATVMIIDVFLTDVSFDVRLQWNFLMELFMDTHVGCMMVDRLLWNLLDDIRSKLMDGKWIGRGVLSCLKINRWFWENRPLILETSTLDFDNANPWCWGKSAPEFWKITSMPFSNIVFFVRCGCISSSRGGGSACKNVFAPNFDCCWSYEKSCRGDDPCNFSISSPNWNFCISSGAPSSFWLNWGKEIAATLFSSAAQLSKHGLLQFARPASFCLCWCRTHGMCKSISAWWSFEKVAKYIILAFWNEDGIQKKLMVWRWCFVPTREFSGCRWNTSEACNSKCFVWRWSRPSFDLTWNKFRWPWKTWRCYTHWTGETSCNQDWMYTPEILRGKYERWTRFTLEFGEWLVQTEGWTYSKS